MRVHVPVLVVSLLGLGSASAEIVDRVAVSIGNQVITASEIRERVALTAFENGVPLPENGNARAEAMKQATEQLIDQKLVEKEMLVGRYASMSDSVSAPLVAQYRQEHSMDVKQLESAIRDHGLSLLQLQRDLARQADLLKFLNLRFRPAVQVTEEDIRKYYRDRIAPGNTPQHTVTLDDARPGIEELLTNQRADKELDAWLKDQRKRSKIEYRAGVFPAPVEPTVK